MCESHTYGKTNSESNVSEIKLPGILGWARNLLSGNTKETQETIASTLDKNIADIFLDNKDQRAHFEKLHSNEEKLKYMNGIITTVYTKKISEEYRSGKIQAANNLELEMGSYIAAASKIIFGNTTTKGEA